MRESDFDGNILHLGENVKWKNGGKSELTIEAEVGESPMAAAIRNAQEKKTLAKTV